MTKEECEQRLAEIAREFIAVAKEYDKNCTYLTLSYIDEGDNYFSFHNKDAIEGGEFPIQYAHFDNEEGEE